MVFLKWLASLRTPAGDIFFQWITFGGQGTLILGVLCALYWCIDKKLAIRIGFTYFAAGLCVQTLKIAARIPRPWILDSTFVPVKSAVPGATGYSFPSGHTMAATSLYGSLALSAPRKWMKAACVFVFLIIGFSRMYLGVHTPKDVAVSMGISLFFVILFWKEKSVFDAPSHRKITIIACLLSLFSLLCGWYSWHVCAIGAVPTTLSADTMKSAGAGLGFALSWYLEQRFLRFDPTPFSPQKKAVIFIIGFLLTLFLYAGLKVILPGTLLGGGLRYFILIFWVIYTYPALFTQVLKKWKWHGHSFLNEV